MYYVISRNDIGYGFCIQEYYRGCENDYYMEKERYGRFCIHIELAKRYYSKQQAENALKRMPLRLCNTYNLTLYEVEIINDEFVIKKVKTLEEMKDE